MTKQGSSSLQRGAPPRRLRRPFLLAALLAVAWIGAAPGLAHAQRDYARLSEQTAELCDGEQLAASACAASPADRTIVAPLCRGDATAAQLAAAIATPCAIAVPSRGGAPLRIQALRGLSPSLVADFFVARLEAELAHFVKRRVASRLCGEAQDDKHLARQLMPETCALLSGSGDVGLSGIPAALQADLRELPRRLPDAALGLVTAGSPEHAVLCTLEAAARAYPRLQQRGAVAALQFLASLTPHYRCTGVTPLRQLQTGAKVLAELILQTANHIVNGGALDPRAVAAAAKLIVDALPLPAAEKAALETQLGKAADPLTRGLEVVLEVASGGQNSLEQLARGLDALAELVSLVSSQGSAAETAALLRAVGAFTGGRYRQALLHLQAIGALDAWMAKHQLKHFWKAVGKLGPLVAGLADAKSDQEARQVLDAAAEPLGSYRVFREEGWAFFISGYAGLSFGGEDGTHVDQSAVFAPLLPVGLEMGWQLGGSSYTINGLVSIIDVGALAAVRFSDNGNDGLAGDGELKRSASKDFTGVVAPGLFLSLGLGDSPFLIGVGAQYLPANRAVFDCPPDVQCASTRAEPVVRGMLFLAVDMPILSIWQ